MHECTQGKWIYILNTKDPTLILFLKFFFFKNRLSSKNIDDYKKLRDMAFIIIELSI